MENVVGEQSRMSRDDTPRWPKEEGAGRGSKGTKKEGDRPINVIHVRGDIVCTGVPRAIHAPYSLVPYSKARK